jgi:ParB/RepB/Spo0J family partition protein
MSTAKKLTAYFPGNSRENFIRRKRMETKAVLKNLSIEDVYPNPNQPRKEFDQGKLKELAESIKQYGVLEPIVVTPRGDKYLIIAGERRYRATILADLKEIPAKVIDVDDKMVEELALIENVQREDLNPIEEARAYKSLLGRWTKEEIAKNIGFTVRRIEERLRLLNLASQFQQMVIDGSLLLGTSTRGLSTGLTGANELAKVSPDKQTLIYSKIKKGELNTHAKITAFVAALELAEKQDALFSFTEVTPEEKKDIDSFEHLLKTAEKVAFGNPDNLKKAALHSSVTLDRIDAIIARLYRIRKVVGLGSGVKAVLGESLIR